MNERAQQLESGAATLLAWERILVGPSEIQIIPPGLSVVVEQGRTILLRNNSSLLSEVLAASVKRTNAAAASGKGDPANIDLSHDGASRAGLVHEIYWSGPTRGTYAAVSWAEPINRAIISGELVAFSVSLLTHEGQVIGFMGPTVGGLLRRTEWPRLSRMEPVRAISKRRNALRQHSRFVDLLLARGATDETVRDEVVALRAERPDLAPGYDVVEAFKAEIAVAEAIRARVAERENAARERTAIEEKGAQFVRLLGERVKCCAVAGSQYPFLAAAEIVRRDYPDLALSYDSLLALHNSDFGQT